jgi:eukaryotic-like serine/threonine-protein kinase
MRVAVALAALFASPCLAAFDMADYPTQWKGSYFCTQGVTDVTLTLRGETGGEAVAVFEFYANATNPDVPDGSFTMRGSIGVDADAASGPSVHLVGERWINRPEGATMVNVSGRFYSNGEAFAGDVTPQQGNRNDCTAIALVRTAVGRDAR